jgi:ornithine cyclodeaminase/alanine dehydrogenase-like protein (mu-crystallin family)
MSRIRRAIEALPPLPDPAEYVTVQFMGGLPDERWGFYSADQMREYALAAIAGLRSIEGQEPGSQYEIYNDIVVKVTNSGWPQPFTKQTLLKAGTLLYATPQAAPALSQSDRELMTRAMQHLHTNGIAESTVAALHARLAAPN